MRTITIKTYGEFEREGEAFQHFDASGQGDFIIRCGGKCLIVDRAEAERLEGMRVPFAYLHDIQRADGEFVTVAIPA